MFGNDDTAWVEDAKDEPGMVEAMRGGDMTLAAVSRRGAATTYTYSLSGITDALKKIGLCK